MDHDPTGNLWFVYRDEGCGSFAKHLCRLPDPSVGHWLGRLRGAAQGAKDADNLPGDLHDRLVAELGGKFYGFALLGLAATPDDRRDGLWSATTEQEARAMLEELVWVEDLRIDEHSVRMKTNNGEWDMAWFVFDDQLARARPDRAAILLHEGPLPATPASVPAGSPFVPEVLPADTYTMGDGPGTTYVIDVGCHSSTPFDDMDHLQLDGIRLPALRAALQNPDDLSGAAREGVDEFLGAHPSIQMIQNVLDGATDPHAASSADGTDTVILFDDRWAAAHPVLANSLLRYAADWDPFD